MVVVVKRFCNASVQLLWSGVLEHEYPILCHRRKVASTYPFYKNLYYTQIRHIVPIQAKNFDGSHIFRRNACMMHFIHRKHQYLIRFT